MSNCGFGVTFPIGLEEFAVGAALVDVGNGSIAVARLPRLGIERVGRELRIDLPDRFAALPEQKFLRPIDGEVAQPFVDAQDRELAGEDKVAMPVGCLVHPHHPKRGSLFQVGLLVAR